MTLVRPPIIVGVDGSESADAALGWALVDAHARAVPVRLVYAFGGSMTYGAMSMYGNLPMPELAYVRTAAEKLLAKSARHAAGIAPDVSVSIHGYDGDAVPVLLEEGRSASTIVLGSRHLGALGSAVLGSVSAAVTGRASCPVVVVRGPAGLPEENPAVVVGVDALEDSEATLTYAFEYASRHGLPLHAVLCWHPDLLAEMMWRPAQPAPERAKVWLAEALAGWQENYSDVIVHSAVVRDHPVAGLVAASVGQHLLVVGPRRQHSVAGTLLGSVSQGVLHHATCPVAVVPTYLAS